MKLIAEQDDLIKKIEEGFTSISELKEIDKNLLMTTIEKTIDWAKEYQRPLSFSTDVLCTGVYNSGKSTLLNILIDSEQEVFATGDVPTTKGIEKYTVGDINYIDTPGLNTNIIDDTITLEAYKHADIILFVSNIQNGGLNATEAEYLRKIAEIIGDKTTFSKSILFALSNMHQLSDELSATKILKAHKENIKLALGIDINEVWIYDALTYKNGLSIDASAKLDIFKDIYNLLDSKKYEDARILMNQSGLTYLMDVVQNKVQEKSKATIAELRNIKNDKRYEDLLCNVESLLLPVKEKALALGLQQGIYDALNYKSKLFIDPFAKSNIFKRIHKFFNSKKYENARILISQSGLPQLMDVIQNKVQQSKATAVERRNLKIDKKYNDALYNIEILVTPIKNQILIYNDSLDNLSNNISSLIEIKNSLLNEIDNFDINSSNISTYISNFSYAMELNTYSNNDFYKSSSYNKAMQLAKSRFSTVYNKRSIMLKETISKIMDNLTRYNHYEMSDSNYYYQTNKTATVIISNYAKQISTITNVSDDLILSEIMVLPQIDNSLPSEFHEKLSDGVIKHGQYYSADFYVEQKIIIDEMEYSGDSDQIGLFKLFDSGKRYYVQSYDPALDAMVKDMQTTLDSNASYVLVNVNETINKFKIELNNQLKNRVNILDNLINEAIEKNNTEIAIIQKEKDYMLKTFIPLSTFLELDDIYLGRN